MVDIGIGAPGVTVTPNDIYNHSKIIYFQMPPPINFNRKRMRETPTIILNHSLFQCQTRRLVGHRTKIICACRLMSYLDIASIQIVYV